jgi:hypothetical protein
MKTQTKAAPTSPAAKSKTAVRGKYFNQLPQGTNLAIIDSDLHAHFPDSESVNRALHAFLAIREQMKAATRPSSKTQSKAA